MGWAGKKRGPVIQKRPFLWAREKGLWVAENWAVARYLMLRILRKSRAVAGELEVYLYLIPSFPPFRLCLDCLDISRYTWPGPLPKVKVKRLPLLRLFQLLSLHYCNCCGCDGVRLLIYLCIS